MTDEKEISEETRKDLMNLQNMQRQLQIVAGQKQRFELEVTQIDTALAELQKAEGKAYKAVGAFLLESTPKDIIEDLNENNDVAAVNSLGAFINAVQVQRGNKIPEADADALIAAAQQIIDLLLAE